MIFHIIPGAYIHISLPIIQNFIEYTTRANYFFLYNPTDLNIITYEKYFNSKGFENYKIINEQDFFYKSSKINYLNPFLVRLNKLLKLKRRVFPKKPFKHLVKRKNDVVVLHGELTMYSDSFFKCIKDFENLTWVCWGGVNIAELGVEAFFLNSIKRVVCLTSYDKSKLIEYSPTKAYFVIPYIWKNYCFPELLVIHKENKILLGNSAHYIEDYKKILPILVKIRDFQTTVMLNYGATKENIETFKSMTKELFVEKVEFWEEVENIDNYLKRLSTFSVYVSPSFRQTGLGAIYHCLLSDIKLYLEGVNYKWFVDLGFKVSHVNELNDISSLYEIVQLDSENIIYNRTLAQEYLNPKKMASKWDHLFENLN